MAGETPVGTKRLKNEIILELSANSDVPYFATLTEAVQKVAPGGYFKTNSTDGSGPHPNKLWFYRRVLPAPFYEAMLSGAVPVAQYDLDPVKEELAELGSEIGATKVGFGERTVKDAFDDFLNVRDFGAIGDGTVHTVQEWIIPGARGRFPNLTTLQAEYPHVTALTDTIDWAAIQAALNKAKSFVIADEPSESYGYVRKGGAMVYLPSGSYKTNRTLEFWLNVSIRGAGMNSSIITASHNGQILRNDPTTTASGTYNREGSALMDFGIMGNNVSPLQDGISLLRWISSPMRNVSVSRVGGDGVVMLECTANEITNVRIAQVIGDGLVMKKGTVGSWGTAPNDLPSNGNVFNNLRVIETRGHGILLEDACNGTVFNDTYVEYCNYGEGNANTGYQIVIRTNTYCPIIFNRLWSEGSWLRAHVLLDNINAQVVFNNWRHFAHGALVDRALVATGGSVVLRDPWVSSNAYPSINGSKAPYRINKAAVGIEVYGHRGATVSGLGIVEDMDGSQRNLSNNLFQMGRDAMYGNFKFYMESGGVSSSEWYRDDELTAPFLRVEPFYRALIWTDVALKRVGDHTLGLDNRGQACYFDLGGGGWAGNHAVFGGAHTWVDSTGKFRFKNGVPTGDTDGGTPLMGSTGKLPAQTDSTATDVAGLVADFNALLAKLRAEGVMAV